MQADLLSYTEQKIKAENEYQNNTITRRKRELPFACSNVLSRLWFENVEGGVCAEGVAEDVKRALELSIKRQEYDSQALNVTKTILTALESEDDDLVLKVNKLNDFVKKDETIFLDLVGKEEQFHKMVYSVLSHLAAELVFRGQAEVVSNLIKASGEGFLSMYDFPLAMRQHLLTSTLPPVLLTELAKGSRLLSHIRFRFAKPEPGIDYDFQINVTLPYVTRSCQVYELERLGILVSRYQCLVGPDFRGAVIIDCASEGLWVTSKECVNKCRTPRGKYYLCHVTECGGTQRYVPDWLFAHDKGKLVGANLENFRICASQPTVLRVADDQYLLTRNANVTKYSKSSVDLISVSAGTLLATACNKENQFEVNGIIYKPGSCQGSDRPNRSRLSITMNGTLDVLELEDDFPENSTFEAEVKDLITSLDSKDWITTLHERQELYKELGLELNADLATMSVVQHQIAKHVAKISDETAISFNLKDKIMIGFSVLMALISIIISSISLVVTRYYTMRVPIRKYNFFSSKKIAMLNECWRHDSYCWTMPLFRIVLLDKCWITKKNLTYNSFTVFFCHNFFHSYFEGHKSFLLN